MDGALIFCDHLMKVVIWHEFRKVDGTGDEVTLGSYAKCNISDT